MHSPDRRKSETPPQSSNLPAVDLFTDGSCRGKKRKDCGGWAFILRHRSTGVEKVQCGGLTTTSSERVEIYAVINGLSALKRRSRVLVHCDSIAIVTAISQFMPEWKRFGWRQSPKAKELIRNADLWQILDALLEKHEVAMKWVKGHAGHPENERCDALSYKAAIALAENNGKGPTMVEIKPDPATSVISASRARPDEKLPGVDLFTDGACIANPGPGGWAFILRHCASGVEKEQGGGLAGTTNNRMEMLGVIKGLAALKRRSRVAIYSDSQYVVQGIRDWIPKWKLRGWRRGRKARGQVKNVDLWKQLDGLLSQHDVSVNWVKGHAGHPENERCDVLSMKEAQAVAKNPNAEKDVRAVEKDDGLFEAEGE